MTKEKACYTTFFFINVRCITLCTLIVDKVYICTINLPFLNFITMETPLAVANYFIKKAQETGLQLTTMKLVKLVYISHGWYYGLTGEQLLTEQVEAWKYGPVIPTIYHEFKKYGNGPVGEMGYVFEGMKTVVPIVKDENVISFLDKIWDVYSSYSAMQLSTMTHMEGTPWYKTWHEKGGKNIHSAPIANDLIESHYKAKAASKNNEAPH